LTNTVGKKYVHVQLIRIQTGRKLIRSEDVADQEYLGYLIARTHKALKKKITAIVGDYNLTVPQYGVLRRLYQNDGLPARDLVALLFMDSSTIMAVIDRLEAKGLVRREANRLDRRINNIHLTSKAKTMLPDLLAQVDELDQALHALLSPEETRSLRSALDRLYDFAVDQEGLEQSEHPSSDPTKE